MELDRSESRYEHRGEREDRDDSPNRSKDRKKGGRGDERDHRTKDRERSRRSGDDLSKERRKDDRDEKDRSRDGKAREKDLERDRNRDKERERDKDRKERDAVKDKERDVVKDKERDAAKDKERDAAKDSERVRDKERGKEKNKEKDKNKERERAREKEKDREKEKHKEKAKEKERVTDQDKENSRDRASRKHDENYGLSKDSHGGKDDKTKNDDDYKKHRDVEPGEVLHYSEKEQTADGSANKADPSTKELEDRISRMKEERLKKKTEDSSDILSWVKKLRKIEAKKMSKILDEQDNVQDESDGEVAAHKHELAGVKVLHGLDKVMEGGAVVLTLKDQNILADGDINEDVDMLENVEIGEQKQRDDAYKAAKKKPGTYVDKYSDELNTEKRMLPQYDDPNTDEGITLDEQGRIAGEAEKRLGELRRRLTASQNIRSEDLSLPAKTSSDYFTPEEMLKFKKPKKKKSLRKKDKLDIAALEAEAVSSGLGAGDLGSRKDTSRQVTREEKNKADAERRDNAFQLAYAKADEALKSLRDELTLPVKAEAEDDDIVFADDEEQSDLYKSLDRARKLALKKKEEASGPKAVVLLASTMEKTEDEKPDTTGESTENKVVFSEMEEFVWGLQLGEETQEPNKEDVFMEEDEDNVAPEKEITDEPGGWSEVNDTEMEENPIKEAENEIVPDDIIHEVSVGKGLSGALKLLQERGTLKEGIDWGGRNMDKKKSKLVGIVGGDDDDDEPKEKTQRNRQLKDETRSSSSGNSKEMRPPKVYHEKDIHIERTDEFGRILTPKEAFRILSHKFHGKQPGKMKQEKRMKQYFEELKTKQMKSSDTPSMSAERMREAQAQLKTPYLVLSGNVKPGQTSDPRSGFATVEKDFPGGLTPMLGDRKVEHFLGIKRKPEPENLEASKKPKP